MGARSAFCLFLAVLLTAGVILMMFPVWLYSLFPEIKIPGDIVNFDDLSVYHFPFYGGDASAPAAYGISNVIKSYSDYVVSGVLPAPNISAELLKIYDQESFLSTLYAFTLISLLTIPVYMLLRLAVYDAVYAIADNSMMLLRILWRGVVAASASLVTVFLTWFLYRTLVFELAYQHLSEKVLALTNQQFALNATNIALIVVIGIAVIALLRATLFRGSIFSSVLGAFLRTALYLALVAIISTFIGQTTTRTLLFMLAAVFAIGCVKSIFLPEKRSYSRARR